MATDVFSKFNAEVDKRHQEMLGDLESINVDDLKSEGVTLSFGGKTFKFTDLEVTDNNEVEERLRQEFKEKLNLQQQRIREKINSKINQLLLMHQNKQQELERKEKQLKKKYSEAAMMPEITEQHMLRGLSVVKGNRNDELTWIYRGIYNPRFVVQGGGSHKSRKAIPSRLVNRLRRPMLLIIKTKGSQITSVATKQLNTNQTSGSLPNFSHYHQTGTGDCWGSWRHADNWRTPDHIIKCAKDAEAVLETINFGSLANRSPASMPRSATIQKAVENEDEIAPQTVEREGGSDSGDDVWQTL